MFDAFEDDFLRFDEIPLNKRLQISVRPDIYAFRLLDELVPPKPGQQAIGSASHDEIWLATDCDALKAVATPEQLRDLHRCGVRYDEDNDSLAMFV